MDEEKPSKSDTTFLITPAAAAEVGGAVGGVLGADDAIVIFCIDISGSMCVTTEVRINISLVYTSLNVSLSLSLCVMSLGNVSCVDSLYLYTVT